LSGLEELIEQIEELRLNLIKIKEGKSFTDPEVLAASQELDVVLHRYQVMLMKKKRIRIRYGVSFSKNIDSYPPPREGDLLFKK